MRIKKVWWFFVVFPVFLTGCNVSNLFQTPSTTISDDPTGEVSEEADFFSQNSDGSYTFSLKGDGDEVTQYFGSRCGYSLWKKIGDTDVSAAIDTSVRVTKTSGVASAGYGLFFSLVENDDANAETMLLVMVNNSGQYYICAVDGSTATNYTDGWVDSGKLTKGTGVTNKIRVSYDTGNAEYVLYLNGTEETRFTDKRDIDWTDINSTGYGYLAVISPDDSSTTGVTVTYK
jgi:hypothetical protein